MALTTYTELQAAIAGRLHRTDLTTQIVDYITLAEKRINRALRLDAQETEATLTATVGSRSMTVPTLYGSSIALYLTTYLPRIKLEYRLPTEMQVYSDNGPSDNWTIDGSVISTDSPADLAYTYAFRYVAAMSLASTTTNTVLTNYPDLYLYGALIEAGADIKDNELVTVSNSRWEQALTECANDAHKSKSLAKLTTELSGSGRSNIIRGI
jgi:hypothetical protein